MSGEPTIEELVTAVAKHEAGQTEDELEQVTSKIAQQLHGLLPHKDRKVALGTAVYTFRRVKVSNYKYGGETWVIASGWEIIRGNAVLQGTRLRSNGVAIENGKHFFLGNPAQRDRGLRSRIGAAEKLSWATPEERLAFVRELPQLCEELAKQVPGKAEELRRLGQWVRPAITRSASELAG